MSVLRITRFTSDSEELLARRAALIDAVRESFTGLTDTQLTRAADGTWVDLWQWESVAQLEAAVAGAPKLPEAPLALGLIKDASEERLEVVELR
jgi:hypothetical protein